MCVCSQSCPSLCSPMNCNPPDSFVHRIFHARIVEWVAIYAPGDFPDARIEPTSLASPALAGRVFIASVTWGL